MVSVGIIQHVWLLPVLSSKVIDAFEANEFAIGVFIDLSKAFDTINHNILLSKLYRYGIRGVALKFFTSYLNNRLQCISMTVVG